MNILAIDPGVKTGWAAFTAGTVMSGVQEFPLGRGDSPGMRYLRFHHWLLELVHIAGPALVVYERPFMRGGYATEFLSALTSRIQEICAVERIEYEAVNPVTLKKATCGTARADKPAMVLAAETTYGRKVRDDNEADALNLLAMAMRENDIELRKEG